MTEPQSPPPFDAPAIEHARSLMARGFAPIPVPRGEKGPKLKAWQKLRLSAEDLPRYFNVSPANIGVLLGEPSGCIVDIDLDHPQAVELADRFLPATGMVWGRDSKHRSHRLYRLTEPVDTRKWSSKTAGSIVELRSTGCQTIAPGSTHPSSEAVRWDETGEPLTIAPADLIVAVEALANAVLAELGEASPASDSPAPRPPTHARRTLSNYGREALRREAEYVAAAAEGTRNNTLNDAAFKIGTLVGGGEIEQAEAEAELIAAARACGLLDAEASATINSGIAAGMKQPRQRPDDSRETRTRNDAAHEDDAQNDEKPPTQSEQLVRLGMNLFRLGQTPKREPFAALRTGPNVAMRLGGSGGSLRDILAREHRRRSGRVMSATAFNDAINTLRGEAMEAECEPTFLRVGPHEGGIVLDLGSADGAAVVVDAEGWRVVERSPIMFQRTPLTGVLPKPERGGELEHLRELLNVSDETWPLLCGWLVAALIPDIPHPILMLGGQQGSGKTTAARFICGLFDASDASTRSQPRDPESWAISMANGYAAVIDNVSSIPDWWSDALCKAVTGDGWVRRTLYTDGDVSVLSFRRIVALTSIDAGALRGDLGERVVLVDLEPITPTRRMTERDLEAKYAAMRPRLLGALLDLVSKVLARAETVEMLTMPRMADFARVLKALDDATGTDALGYYSDQGRRIAVEVLEADSVGMAVLAFMADRGEWAGTLGDLLALLGPIRPEPLKADRTWPQNPRGLGARLKRLAPALEARGVLVVPPQPTDKGRIWILRGTTAPTARQPENRVPDVQSGVLARAVDELSNNTTAQTAQRQPNEKPHSEVVEADSGLLGGSGCQPRPFSLATGAGSDSREAAP